jgi:hypothetical protein
LVEDILELPDSHVSGECPWERAKQLCDHYLGSIDTKINEIYGNPKYPSVNKATEDQTLRKLYNLVNAQYDDGRACPIGQLQSMLRKMYHDDPNARHRWFTCASLVHMGIAENLIAVEGYDVELLMEACESDICIPRA